VKGRDAEQKQESWNFRIEHTTGIVSFVLERQEQSNVVRSYSVSSILASDNPRVLLLENIDRFDVRAAFANSINSEESRKKFLSLERKRGDPVKIGKNFFFFSCYKS